MGVGDAQRHRVLQAGAPQVLGVADLLGLREQRVLEQLDALERLAADDVRREGERRRVHVVRRLRAVDVVVRVHAVVRPAHAAEQLVRAVRDHLVHVHVDRGAAAAVHDVDRELAAVLAGRDLVRRRDDRRGELRRQLARREVRACRRGLHVGERGDELELVRHRDARDGEVRDGPHRVRAVQGVARHVDGAERVPLLARLCPVSLTRDSYRVGALPVRAARACPDP